MSKTLFEERWTSVEAEISMEASVSKIQRLVLEYLFSCGIRGSTHQEAEIHFARTYGPSTIRARFSELEKMGQVVESGRTRRTKSNRRAIVWVSIQMLM